MVPKIKDMFRLAERSVVVDKKKSKCMSTQCRERLGIVETKQNRRMLKKKRRDKGRDKQEGVGGAGH